MLFQNILSNNKECNYTMMINIIIDYCLFKYNDIYVKK